MSILRDFPDVSSPPPADMLTSVQAPGAISDRVKDLRDRELELFAVHPNSPMGIRLAAVRGELVRVLAGQRIRLEVIERALEAYPGHLSEEAEPEAVEPACVEVGAGG